MTTLRPLLQSTRAGETPLLQRRMIALRLDVEAWLNLDPEMFGDLQRSCAACVSPSQCAYDLGAHLDDPTWHDWRDYCPNVARLRMLVALQGALTMNSRSGGRSDDWVTIKTCAALKLARDRDGVQWEMGSVDSRRHS